MSESEELAKAAQEIAKLGTTVVEKGSNATGFIAKYIDEPLSVLVGQWVDSKKLDRWENQVKIQDRVNAILKGRGCKTRRLILPKLGIPLIDNALLEDDDDLRQIWCKLIANSLDPNFDKQIRNAFIDILKNLTPLDARILEYIYDNLPDKNDLHKITDYNENKVTTEDIIRNLNALEPDIYISLFNLKRVQCIWDYDSLRKDEIKKTATYVFNRGLNYTLTPLGYSLVEACMK